MPTARPSVYALMGSASMLGGSIRQTLSIVAILTECANDLNFSPVLIVAIFAARSAAQMIRTRGLDEEMMERKGVPYLDAELPREMEGTGITAAELCDPLPASAWLAPSATTEEVQQALRDCSSNTFPVVREGRCLGLITRGQLLTAIAARVQAQGGTSPVQGSEQQGQPRIAVHWIMHRTPMIILETMPVNRLHPLFTRSETGVACVVAADGLFVGLLSRGTLIDAISRHEAGNVSSNAKDFVARGMGADMGSQGAEHHRDCDSISPRPPARNDSGPEELSPPPSPPSPQVTDAPEDSLVTELRARIAELEAVVASSIRPVDAASSHSLSGSST